MIKDSNIQPYCALTRRLLLALAVSVVAVGVSAQDGTPTQFRLVLGISVEGLDDASLDLLRNRLSPGGFRMLAEKGISIPTADYGTALDVTAATVTAFSGAHPAISGIDATKRYNREYLSYKHIFEDSEVMGNFTQNTYSPRNLQVSNLTDEINIAEGGLSLSYAIAPTPGQAIALAGHTANAALWIDPTTYNWAGSTFYREMPTIVANRNRMAPLRVRIDTMQWAPLGEAEFYPGLPNHLTQYPFRYVFQRSNPARMDMFMSSPLVNNEVTNIAGELIEAKHLGNREDGGIDVLNVGYTLTPFIYGTSNDYRFEHLDAILRLDKNLEQLFATVERTVGLEHTLIYLAGTPPSPWSLRDDEKWNIPYGQFSSRRAASLLNMFLIAKYGNGEYISDFRDRRLYLNQRTITDKGLDEVTLRKDAAELLIRMSGVDGVYTADDIINGNTGENAEALRRNTSIASISDILISVAPGYELVDDYNGQLTSSANSHHFVRRAIAATSVAFIMAPNVQARCINTPVDIRVLAPTVARILRIRSPNGATIPPIKVAP